MLNYLGWTLLLFSIIWHFYNMKYQHSKRINLNNYIVYLLLNDEIRENHKIKFGQWIKESNAKNALELSLNADNAIENIADQLSKSSALGAHAMLWNSEFAKQLKEKYEKQNN